MQIKIFSYSKGSELGGLISKIANSYKNLKFIIPSKKDKFWWYSKTENLNLNYDLWTWQDIYDDICLNIDGVHKIILSPPDHLLVLKNILDAVLKSKPEKINLWPGLLRSGFPGILSDDVHELLNEHVKPENLILDENEPSGFLLPEVYSKYLKYLDENNLIDSAQIWTSALEVLNLNQDWGKNYNLIFTGFLSFNHGQFELLQALNARCENLIILKPEAYLNNFHDVNEQFEIINIGSQNKKSSGKIIEIPAPEPGLEPEILARNLALWSQNKGPFNEFLKFSGFDSIGIMTQNGREFQFINALTRYKIPFNLTAGFKISETLPGQILESIRNLNTRYFPTYETAMLLTRQCFAGKNFDVNNAFRSGRAGLENWIEYLSSMDENKNNSALTSMKAIQKFLNVISHKNTPAKIMSAFYEFLTTENLWLDKMQLDIISEFDEAIRLTASAIQTVGEKVLALNELLPDLGSVQDKKIFGDEAFDFLESWCRNSHVRAPLQITNAIKLFIGQPPVLASFKIFIMTGITQKNWSGNIMGSPLLGNSQRDLLAQNGTYLPSVHDKANQREALFRRLIFTGENLTIILRPELDEENRPVLESPFLKHFLDDMPNWKFMGLKNSGINILINSDGYNFNEINNNLESTRKLPEINFNAKIIGVSELKKFLNCPLQWYLNSRAKLYEKKFELVTRIDWGNMTHSLFENVWKNFRTSLNQNNFIPLVNSEWEKLISGDEIYKNYSRLVNDFRLKRLLDGVKFRVMRLGNVQAEIIKNLNSAGYFHEKILLEEEAQLITTVDNIKFPGQCDRIEIIKNKSGVKFALITDYKEGKSESYETDFKIKNYAWNFEDREKFKYGLQISGYVKLFNENYPGLRLGGAYFLGLEDGKLSGTFDDELKEIFIKYSADKKLKSLMSEREDEGLYSMKCAAKILNSGKFAPDYKNNNCKYCGLYSICRKGELNARNLFDDEEFNDDAE